MRFIFNDADDFLWKVRGKRSRVIVAIGGEGAQSWTTALAPFFRGSENREEGAGRSNRPITRI